MRISGMTISESAAWMLLRHLQSIDTITTQSEHLSESYLKTCRDHAHWRCSWSTQQSYLASSWTGDGGFFNIGTFTPYHALFRGFSTSEFNKLTLRCSPKEGRLFSTISATISVKDGRGKRYFLTDPLAGKWHQGFQCSDSLWLWELRNLLIKCVRTIK